MAEVQLEYRPCKCPSYIQDKGIDVDNPAEHFEIEVVAGIRFRELSRRGKVPRVHCQGVHVRAATVDGERFEEQAK